VETIKPRLSSWNFAARERELFGDSPKIETWRLANQSRRLLAEVIRQLWLRTETPEDVRVEKIDPALARRLAGLQLASVVTRSVGAQMALIACGYEAEALAHARTSMEALLRTRQVLDERSGESARRILVGQRPRGLKSIAHAYGSKREVELLDHFAHADVRILRTLSKPVTKHSGILELRPTRGQLVPEAQLLEAARTASREAVAACEIFGVALEIPEWIAAQLAHYRDHPLPVEF
jgi:hypothetical protein